MAGGLPGDCRTRCGAWLSRCPPGRYLILTAADDDPPRLLLAVIRDGPVGRLNMPENVPPLSVSVPMVAPVAGSTTVTTADAPVLVAWTVSWAPRTQPVVRRGALLVNGAKASVVDPSGLGPRIAVLTVPTWAGLACGAPDDAGGGVPQEGSGDVVDGTSTAAIDDVFVARELLRKASVSLVGDEIQFGQGLALLADADTHLATAGSRASVARDTLSAVVLAGSTPAEAGVSPLTVRRVLLRGVLTCDRRLEEGLSECR